MHKNPLKLHFSGFLSVKSWCFVGLPGFEPGMTGPESVVLPLHHSPMIFVCGCKDTNKLGNQNISAIFFAKILKLVFPKQLSPLKNTKIEV